MRGKDGELEVLTWRHHAGMGNSENAEQQTEELAQPCVCLHTKWIYLCPQMLEKQINLLTLTSGCLCFGKSAFSRVQHSAYQCVLVALWLWLALQLSLPTFLFHFLPLFVSVCMCALPEGKIRHELCKQALQSCFTLQTFKWNNWLLCSDRGEDGDSVLVKYHYYSQTHNLSLSASFPFSIFLFILSVVYHILFCVLILCSTPSFLGTSDWR